MGIRPIFSALLRNRAGAILVAVQIAITLAIVVNAIYLTQQRVSKIGRPSGIDDQNIFAFWVNTYQKDYDFLGMVREDMAMLRRMPDIIDVDAHAAGAAVGKRQLQRFLFAARQEGREFAGQHVLHRRPRASKTLGVTLSAGSDFDASDVEYKREDQKEPGYPPMAIISQGFAKALFKDAARARQDLLRRPEPSHPHRRRHLAHAGFVGGLGQSRSHHALPAGGPRSGSTQYVIRTKPGSIDRVMTAVEVALRKRDANRVVATPMTKMSDMKRRSYAGDSLMAVTLVDGDRSRAGVQLARHLRTRHVQREQRARARSALAARSAHASSTSSSTS